jgi:hypothetical protein
VSRAYRITVKGSVSRVVHVEDGVCTTLDLLPILPKERQAEILAEELAGRGFARDGVVARRAEEDGIVVEVDVATGTVSVKAEATADVRVEREMTRHVPEEALERGRKEAQEQIDRQAEKEAAGIERRALEDVTKKLERRLGDLRHELDAVTAKVTADALKEKARQLGEIQELHEDTETGELTIKVRL